jgi:hypothetical protein
MPPNGQFSHAYVTVRSVQAHIDPNASDNSPGWQELAPQLANQPVQIHLFSKPQTTCVLAQLGSASLPVGSYKQIRLLRVSNSPDVGSALPANNACAGNGYNCVVLDDTTIHELQLSSQANTGLKIPPGQIVGGPLQVTAGCPFHDRRSSGGAPKRRDAGLHAVRADHCEGHNRSAFESLTCHHDKRG